MPEPIASIIPAGELDQVSDVQLARYARLIYDRTGIRVSPQKKTLLSNRVRRRLKETGIKDFEQYYRHLRNLRAKDSEWDAFLQEITTHETYLFRDQGNWDWFRNTFLPQRAAAARSKQANRSLRIWSAAASTGDEAMTMACCIAACLPTFSQWKIEIVATDIGTGAIEEARGGVFGERAMRLVPEDYRRRFFTKAKDAQLWQAKPVIAKMATYRQHNLLDPLREKPFDLVVLKNVLIYFDRKSKKRALENLQAVIAENGYLLVGAAEGVSDLLADLIRVQPWLFRRPGREGSTGRGRHTGAK